MITEAERLAVKIEVANQMAKQMQSHGPQKTLRDEFAMEFLVAALRHDCFAELSGWERAVAAYSQADALLSVREI